MKKTLYVTAASMALALAASADVSWDFTPTWVEYNGENVANMSITLTFDVTKLTTALQNNANSAILTAGHMGSEGWGIGTNAEGELCGWLDGKASTSFFWLPFAELVPSLASSVNNTLTIVVVTGTENVSGYCPGTAVYLSNGDRALNFSSRLICTSPVSTLTFHGAFADALVGQTADDSAIDSVEGTERIESSNVVPEPTSTTLSLLALTALAARRRRK